MNGFNNDPNNNRGNPVQPVQPQKGAVSGGEMFVGINLLSKIGVVFIIIGIIAFSAASEGILHVGIRLALVIALGFLMLGVGELFYRKGSHVFASALIFGGVAELFICSLIGYHGFDILSEGAALGVSAGAAAIGILLSARYKSQGLLIVTVISAALPLLFINFGYVVFCIAAVYLVAVHGAVAVLARHNGYTAAFMTGIITAMLEPYMLGSPSMSVAAAGSSKYAIIVNVLCIICCAVCYGGGLLLNAVQEFGRLSVTETVELCLIVGAAVIGADFPIMFSIGRLEAAVALLMLAVIFIILALLFSMRFGDDGSAVNVLFNFFFISTVLAVFDFPFAQYVIYVILHIFAAGVLIAGLIFERRLFRGWGYALIALSEIIFFGVLILNHEMGQRLFAIIVNLILWFGIMAVFIIKDKHENNLFRAYTLAAFLNAGMLCSDTITRYLVDLLGAGEVWSNPAAKLTFSALLCTVPWLILGFVVGRFKYMKTWGMVSSFMLYGIGLICLLVANSIDSMNRAMLSTHKLGIAAVIVTIAVNVASVLTVLDMTAQISSRAPKFTKAVGLIVSGYALLTLTTILGTNNYVKFTSYIISILYIAMAAVWIVIGFKKLNALLRRFGLALALLSSAKLFLFDFSNISNMGRTLLFIGFGITLLCIAFGYAIAEKRLKDKGL
ncbi:MAG: DUF2339 domain-containing protein [Oscillospiraceae bacterium]|nr:DUF2339 domain-containing protein [Oscillospiraceae bacterium]